MSESNHENTGDGTKELEFLNVHHNFPFEEGSSLLGSTTLFGQWKNRFKRSCRRMLFRSLLPEYLEREQRYQANLVRLLNAWNVRHERDLHGLRHALAVSDERLKTAESVIRGLERIVAAAGKAAAKKPSFGGSPEGETVPSFQKDYSYLLLENRYRGSEEEIEKRLAVYVPLLRGMPGPVLEIGSGRGELLALLKDAGIASYGVELDAAMVERGEARGLDSRLENGIFHLENAAPGSFGGIIAIQVLEHFPFELLKRFLELAKSRVHAGGLVIAETIDTSSLVALSQNYFRDPTHTAPLHPETLSYLFELAGLEVLEVKKLSAFPPGFELQKIPMGALSGSADFKPLNENVEKLNSLLYGFQDYSIIARVNG